MKNLFILLLIITVHSFCSNATNEKPLKLPTVMVATLIRNKAHILPYFFSYLENLDYPKDRISLWIRSDHNNDNSVRIIQTWLNKMKKHYHSVDFEYSEEPKIYLNQSSNTDWPRDRFANIIQLKEDALSKAKSIWADFIFFLDADIIFTETSTLKLLTSLNVPIVAPMLTSRSAYSNFWCGMSNDYYYLRTDDYRQIYDKRVTGTFSVPMVHSALLINLKYLNSDLLTFNREKLIQNQKEINFGRIYDGPFDDIIIFAISANSSGLEMYINNLKHFGYISEPLASDETFENDIQQVVNIQISIINDVDPEIHLADEMKQFAAPPKKDKLTLDHIYMINLDRRSDRRKVMETSLDILGLEAERYVAVDGKNLSPDIVNDMGIKFLTGYEDPYHHRSMTMGEVGCFLSHYNIWKEIVQKNLSEVLVLEDDIRFEINFKENALDVIQQARSVGNWDFIYIGRKILENQEENYINNTRNLVKAGYSYWTLGYLITLKGAQKLIDAKPLEKLIPVDEFLPVMFNDHPNNTWLEAYSPRDLIAFSAAPLLVFPTRYTGEIGYISDTEDSELIDEILESDRDTMENKINITENDFYEIGVDKQAIPSEVAGNLGSKHDPSEF